MKKGFFLTLVFFLFATPSHAIDGLKYHKLIDNYYKTQAIDFLWLDQRGKATAKTNQLLNVLAASWQHGLNPASYHIEDIQNYLASNKNIAPRFFDQMISDAFVSYSRDMTGMRVDAKKIEQDGRYWRQPYSTEWLLQQAQKTNNITEFLQSIEPQGPLYDRLQLELKTLSTQPLDARAPLILTETNLLRPGATHTEFVPLLRAFLDVPSSDWNKNTYDDALVNAVVSFQRENGLKADGIIGPKTLNLMNKSQREKIYQIIANMERLRWLEPKKPEKYVLVNVPSATLWAIENGQILHEMPVIVGRKDRPTLSFVSEITGVRYNPTWTIPKTIKREDMLPKLMENPMSLAEKGIDIKMRGENGWASADPATIDWTMISTDEQLKAFQMVQGPGPSNPLGDIRILMPNKYNIYLHDTSSPEYFRSSDRNVSSGCVRVREPEALADFILSENSNWDQTFTQRMLDSKKMTDIATQRRMPVYLLYLTIWMNDDGSITYGPDSYEWDKLMIAELYNTRKIPDFTLSSAQRGTTLASR